MKGRYPLLLPAAGFAAGLLLARADAVSFALMGAAAAVAVLLALLNIKRSLFLALAAGLLWGTAALFVDGWRAAADASWTDDPVVITAEVLRLEEQPVRSRLRLTGVVRQDGQSLAGDVDIYLYGRQRQQQLLPGQQVRLTAKLHHPSNRLNPGSFDYEGYCFDRHIALIGSAAGAVNITNEAVSWLELARQRVRAQLKSMPERERGVLLALVLADRSRIPVATEEHFAASGAAHLLAISGLHIGMVAGWVFVIAWWGLTRREASIVSLPVRSVALAAGVTAALVYATFAGWPLPTQRAVLMAAAGVLAWWLRRRNGPINTLCAALLVILLLDPAAIVSVSLWLSFTAVAALLLWPVAEARESRRWQKWLKGLFWVSLVATLATLPVITYVFERIPVYSLIANLLMVPLYAVWVLPAALAGALLSVMGVDSLALMLLGWSGAGIEAGSSLLAEIYQWPAANMWVAAPSLSATLLYGGALVAAILLWQLRRAWGAAIAVTTVLLYVSWIVPEQLPAQPQLHVWDVGQGASASILLPQGKVMMIDAPGRYGSRFNGGTIAAAALRNRGMAHADVLVLSHAQSDHAGGAARLVDQLRRVGELWLADVPANKAYRPIQQLAARIAAQGGMVRWLRRGDRLQLGEAAIEVLWPPAGYAPANGNNTSLVLSVAIRGYHILLPGDAEDVVEKALLARGMKVHDVLLIPHHGSRTSSSEPFVEAVAPKHAVAQVSSPNRYGFPHADVVARYRRIGAQQWRSSDGSICFEFGEKSLKADRFELRQKSKRASALQWWQ